MTSNFGLFVQTNKFKIVDVTEFEKFIADTAVTLLDVRTVAEHASVNSIFISPFVNVYSLTLRINQNLSHELICAQ